jgi:hypothetical protein
MQAPRDILGLHCSADEGFGVWPPTACLLVNSYGRFEDT